MITRLAILLVAAMVPTYASAQSTPEDVLIIANKSFRTNTVSKAVLKQVFLRQRRSVDGARAIPINARASTYARARFRKEVLGLSANEEGRYWQARRIRGETREPPSFRNVLKAVFKVRGAISYVPRSKYRKGVARVLMVISAPKPTAGGR